MVGNKFGSSVAVSDDELAVGVPDHTYLGQTRTGATYVYARSGGAWTLQAKLLASDGRAGDSFGSAVALSGGTLVVTAPGVDTQSYRVTGAAYVFVRDGQMWGELQKLEAPYATTGEGFGFSVELSGNSFLVGSGNAAYLYSGGPGGWGNSFILTPGDGDGGIAAGRMVALSGDTALLGGGSSAALVFSQARGLWTQQQALQPIDGDAGLGYSNAVAVSTTTAVVGSYNSAHVFVLLGQTCATPADCGSGYCKDGVCCPTACDAPCQSCATGTCAVVTSAADVPECAGTRSCDGDGVCTEVARDGPGGDQQPTGCSCRAGGTPRGIPGALAVAGLLFLVMRRRRGRDAGATAGAARHRAGRATRRAARRARSPRA